MRCSTSQITPEVVEQGMLITGKSPESQAAQLTLQQQALTNQLD
jgi:hypothetical protein